MIFYQLIIALLFALVFPLLLLYVFLSGRHRRGLAERLGWYRLPQPDTVPSCRIWIHAASIGEINAAKIIIEHFRRKEPESHFILTTMTIHGRDFARLQLGDDICCFLAPLDIPLITDVVIKRINPDIYVCLETELWPLLIYKIKRFGAALVLLNGRLSDRSITRYRKLKFFFGPVIRNFDRIGAISAIDRDRFLELDADPGRVTITGNVKHDVILPGRPDSIRNHWRNLLALDPHTHLFAAASTHAPEETLLTPLLERFSAIPDHLCLLAPRHLDRLGEIEQMLRQRKISFDRLSDCKQGKKRCHRLLVVDTFGDLSELFSVVSTVFMGGSLADYGGHNPMEAAIWNKAVIFGPHMQDFDDEARGLAEAGGGFLIHSVEKLEQLLQRFIDNPAELAAAGTQAGEVARKQQGIGELQAALMHQAISADKRHRSP